MTPDELDAALFSAQREVFRLEVQQSYAGVPDPGWDAWQAGQPIPPRTPDNSPWLAKIAAQVAAGRDWRRVLVVDWPLNPYLRYEFAAFAAHTDVGEQILVVDRDADPGLAPLRDDFWMIDERFVAIMRFDTEHRPLGPAAPAEPVEVFVERRDLALAHATPLAAWLTDHEARLTA